MNKKQRARNRETSKKLSEKIAVCPRCKMRGEYHYVNTNPYTVKDMVEESRGYKKPDSYYGFFVCPDMYDENGRRKEKFIDPAFTGDGALASASGLMSFVLAGVTGMTPTPTADDLRVEQSEAFQKVIRQPIPGLLSVADGQKSSVQAGDGEHSVQLEIDLDGDVQVKSAPSIGLPVSALHAGRTAHQRRLGVFRNLSLLTALLATTAPLGSAVVQRRHKVSKD